MGDRSDLEARGHAMVALATTMLIDCAQTFGSLRDHVEEVEAFVGGLQYQMEASAMKTETVERCPGDTESVEPAKVGEGDPAAGGSVRGFTTGESAVVGQAAQRAVNLLLQIADDSQLRLLKFADELRKADYGPFGQSLRLVQRRSSDGEARENAEEMSAKDQWDVVEAVQEARTEAQVLCNAATRAGIRQRLMKLRLQEIQDHAPPAVIMPSSAVGSSMLHVPMRRSPMATHVTRSVVLDKSTAAMERRYEEQVTRLERDLDQLGKELVQSQTEKEELKREMTGLKRMLWDERRNRNLERREVERTMRERDHVIEEYRRAVES